MNTQPDTKIHDFPGLNSKHWLAIQLKNEGKHYIEIAEVVGKPYNTVASWFRAGGLLEAAYWQYAEQIGNEAVRWSLIRMKALSLRAVETIADIMEDKDSPPMVRLKAANMILDRVMPPDVFKGIARRDFDDDLPEELRIAAELDALEGLNRQKMNVSEQAAIKLAEIAGQS